MSGVSIVVVIVTLLIYLLINQITIKILNQFIKSKNLVLNHIIY